MIVLDTIFGFLRLVLSWKHGGKIGKLAVIDPWGLIYTEVALGLSGLVLAETKGRESSIFIHSLAIFHLNSQSPMSYVK